MNHSPGCLDEERDAMLRAALPVRSSAFRSLLAGRVASFGEIAAEARLTEASARQAAANVASVGMAELDEIGVVGMDGVTMRQTRHCINLGASICARGAPTTLSGSWRLSARTRRA